MHGDFSGLPFPPPAPFEGMDVVNNRYLAMTSALPSSSTSMVATQGFSPTLLRTVPGSSVLPRGVSTAPRTRTLLPEPL